MPCKKRLSSNSLIITHNFQVNSLLIEKDKLQKALEACKRDKEDSLNQIAAQFQTLSIERDQLKNDMEEMKKVKMSGIFKNTKDHSNMLAALTVERDRLKDQLGMVFFFSIRFQLSFCIPFFSFRFHLRSV